MKDDRVYLQHIRDALEKIVCYTESGWDKFSSDSLTQDGVVRNLEIVGEAVKNLSASLKASHPEIPWKQIAGMRDRLAHDYFGVDYELVWGVVESRVPQLQEVVKSLLDDSSL